MSGHGDQLDRLAYEHRQRRRQRELWTKLRAIPEIGKALQHGTLGPAVRLDCPRGHRLPVRVALASREGEGPLGEELFLVALGSSPRRTGALTGGASPFTAAKSVCSWHGCPRLVTAPGFCDEHGGPIETIDPLRTRFRCPQCGWNDAKTTARLLELYAVAVVAKLDSVPLT